ncbi:expressed unknown protein [Seminavis robusta]|uniref:Uncharacterized protein n=1 Tax=Seminavis robusta TaxID=568900 RepID=A0A9N8H7R0_9STRA|nr:expressed unknown protein [Seminavis robusta]|eukprot:Sro147_g067960.1 n/a (410) ;mRNA; f:79557-80885
MCKSDNGNGTSAVVLQRQQVEETEKQSSTTSETKSNTSNGYVIKEQTIGEKLFQAKEDRMYFHKILGFSALASYAYRFINLGPQDGNFNGITPLIFVVHHASLNLSSFVFDIPQRRIRGGFRIWPEYRIHSMVFTFRNLACMLRLWMLLNIVNKDDDTVWYSVLNGGLVNWAIVIATCAAADYGSSLSAQYKSNTVRGTDYFDPYANWFASEMQFQLTAMCLAGGYQRYSLHLVGAFIIQFNSFLMTMRRKNLFSHLTLTTTYGVMLLASMFVGLYEDYFTNDHVTIAATFANLGIILRMGMGVDKYIVWTVVAAGMHAANTLLPPFMDGLPRDPSFYWTIAFWVTKFTCYAFGVRKRSLILKKKKELAESKDKGSTTFNKAGYEVVAAGFVVLSALATYDMLDIFEVI